MATEVIKTVVRETHRLRGPVGQAESPFDIMDRLLPLPEGDTRVSWDVLPLNRGGGIVMEVEPDSQASRAASIHRQRTEAGLSGVAIPREDLDGLVAWLESDEMPPSLPPEVNRLLDGLTGAAQSEFVRQTKAAA